MDVFVVVTCFMNAVQEGHVFSSAEAAQKFIDSSSKQGDPVVRRYTVVGGVVEPGVVYTSSRYDPSSDVHHFEAVYGTYEAANRAAGELGIALRRVIDEAQSQ